MLVPTSAWFAPLIGVFLAADALVIDPGAIPNTHFLPARLMPGKLEESSGNESLVDEVQEQLAESGSREQPPLEEAIIQSIALPATTVLGTTLQRNGTNSSQGMNGTVMSEKNLPTMSRHVNGHTEVADWFNEYPVAENVENAVEALPPVLRSPWTGALLVFFALFAAAMVLLALGYLA